MIWYAARIVAGGVVALVVGALIVFLCLELPASGASYAGDLGAAAGRFAAWLLGFFTGNLGVSSAASAPVGPILANRLAVTLPLIGLGALVAAATALILGYGTTRGSRVLDGGVTAFAQLLGLLPNFWLGLLLVILFALTLRWLPTGGFVPWTSNLPLAFGSLTLPALALGLPIGAMLALRFRDAVLAARAAPYIRADRMRGVSVRDAFRAHGVRHVALAVLAAAAPAAMSLAAGSVLVETVFYLPGLGRLLLDGAAARDVPVVGAAIVVLMATSVLLFVAVRLADGWLDPRISRRAVG